MEFHPSTEKRIFLILILVWADIGMTYMALEKFNHINSENMQVEELSLLVGPTINNYGIVIGLIIGGLINTIIIILISLLFRGPVEHGILMGIFIVAITLNFRLLMIMDAYL